MSTLVTKAIKIATLITIPSALFCLSLMILAAVAADSAHDRVQLLSWGAIPGALALVCECISRRAHDHDTDVELDVNKAWNKYQDLVDTLDTCEVIELFPDDRDGRRVSRNA